MNEIIFLASLYLLFVKLDILNTIFFQYLTAIHISNCLQYLTVNKYFILALFTT